MSYDPQGPGRGQQSQPDGNTPFRNQAGVQEVQYPEASRAGIAMGLGISALMSMFACILLSPFLGGAAWYFGHVEKKAIREGRRDPSGSEQAKVGTILGIVSLVLAPIMILLGLLMIFGVLSIFIAWLASELEGLNKAIGAWFTM